MESSANKLPRTAGEAGEALPLVIAAWLAADPEVAVDLLEGWLGTMDGDGNLSPMCPVVCQWAERAAGLLEDPGPFIERNLPALARVLEREFDTYDQTGTGLAEWPSAELALFPEETAPGRRTVDAAILLSNEAESFSRLAAGHEEAHAKVLDNAEGEQRELDSWLRETFWNEEEAVFGRLEADGKVIPDLSPCGFFPLVWGGRTEEMSEGLRVRMGAEAWQGWTVRGWILFFALLLRTPHTGVVGRMRAKGLPAGATEAEQAAWTVLDAEAAKQVQQAGIPPMVRWIDRRGRMLARGGLAGTGILLILLLGWGFFHRETPQSQDIGELERQARQASEDGRHGPAAALYGQAAKLGHEAYFRYRQAGEWLRMGNAAEAETVYRELLAKEPDAPNVRMNLALAVWKQGRQAEALGLYRALAEDPAFAETPALAARARLAVELIERQLALDEGS